MVHTLLLSNKKYTCRSLCLFKRKRTFILPSIELSLRDISVIVYIIYARAHLRVLMTQKSCTVGMRNAILRNHFNYMYCNIHLEIYTQIN